MPKIAINIDVSNIDRGIEFYSRAFELRVARRLAPDIVELSGMPSPVFLLEKAPGSFPFPDGTPRSYARHWTPVHLDFLVRDIDTAIARVVAAGASSEGPLQTYDWGKIAYFADPFGNGFCLLSYR